MAISSQDADKFRLKHAEELLALFEGARGRPARTTDELAQWLDSVDDDLADDIAREVAPPQRRRAIDRARDIGACELGCRRPHGTRRARSRYLIAIIVHCFAIISCTHEGDRGSEGQIRCNNPHPTAKKRTC